MLVLRTNVFCFLKTPLPLRAGYAQNVYNIISVNSQYFSYLKQDVFFFTYPESSKTPSGIDGDKYMAYP